MNNQTYSKEVEIETAICAFDGYPYAFWDLVSVYNPSLGEWVRVSKENLEKYAQIIIADEIDMVEWNRKRI